MWSEPKRLEKGGDLYRGHIVRTYKNTDLIDIDYVVNFIFIFPKIMLILAPAEKNTTLARRR